MKEDFLRQAEESRRGDSLIVEQRKGKQSEVTHQRHGDNQAH